jgi:protein gp37
MMSTSSIEWTEQTWNPVTGCTIVSAGCKNCYAMRMASRLEAMGQKKYEGTTAKVGKRAVWTGKVNLIADDLEIPLKRKKPTMWFVNSMSDLFHKDIPFDFIDKVFAVVEIQQMASADDLPTFL